MSKWTRFRDRILGKVINWLKDLTGWDVPTAKPEDIHPAKPTHQFDQAPFNDFKWTKGGFGGGHSEMIPGCEIEALNANKDKMTYRWRNGGCEMLGAKDRGDADCLACFFVLKGGKWFGGKFDWISTSRLSRSFSNIHGNYEGWSSADLENVEASAFVIVSRDGKMRTNAIIQEGAL